MSLSERDLDDLIERYIARLRQEVPVAAVYLYGSYADGHPDDESDVDLAVVSPRFGENGHRELVLLGKARLPDALEIEAIPFSVEEHENPSRGSFIREVLKTGRRVA